MTETFSVNPGEWEEVRNSRGMTTPPEAGAIKTRRYNQGDLREFRLMWRNATGTEKAAIEADHAASFGGAETMIWTPPGEGDAIRVRFKPGKAGYSRTRLSATSYAIEVGFSEATEFRSPSAIT
jgi:hypothetical protein